MKTRLIAVIFSILIISQAFSVNIRGEVSSLVTVSNSKSNTEFKLHDLTAIILEPGPFIQSIDLTITLPLELSRYRDSFMINIYSGLNKMPDISVKSYSGTSILSSIVPVSQKLFISIPLTANPGTDIIPGTIISSKVSESDFPLLLAITPVMKGIPSNVLSSMFKLEIMPVLSDKGILNYNISTNTTGSNYTVELDGKPVDTNSIILKTGIHSLVINSDHFRQVTRSFVIEKGETTLINIILEPLLPTVSFDSPEQSTIYLDGNKLINFSGKDIQIEPGEHVVRIELSDYSLTRKFNVEPDKNYKISLLLDILVQDN